MSSLLVLSQIGRPAPPHPQSPHPVRFAVRQIEPVRQSGISLVASYGQIAIIFSKGFAIKGLRWNAKRQCDLQSTFENILRFKRGFFVGRCEISCANVCSFDCDRIRNLILPPEVSENDRTTENARNILLVIYEYQKKYLSKRPQGDNSRATCTSERVPRGKSKTVVTTSTSAGCPSDAVQYERHIVNILLLPDDDFQLQLRRHGDRRNVASDYAI